MVTTLYEEHCVHVQCDPLICTQAINWAHQYILQRKTWKSQPDIQALNKTIQIPLDSQGKERKVLSQMVHYPQK